MDSDLRDPLSLARSCAALLDEKKITDLRVFDVEEAIAITGYFVIGTGLNHRHLKSAVDHVERTLKDRGLARRGLEGYREGKWILLDLGDVVIHLFLEESRKFYDLELLWGDSPRLDLAVLSPVLSSVSSPLGPPEGTVRAVPRSEPSALLPPEGTVRAALRQ